LDSHFIGRLDPDPDPGGIKSAKKEAKTHPKGGIKGIISKVIGIQ
jgi:hypothetical protein